MKKPNFFIVGAPKCGTTALVQYLSTHPDIYMSDPKEPHFFSEEFQLPEFTTWEQYLTLFENAEPRHRIVGEASTHYLCAAEAIPKIYNYNPDAKIVAMLRNPVDLVYSYHSQLFYNGGDEDIADFEQAWGLQASRRQGQNIPKLSLNPATLQYGSIGSLGTQVERLLSTFPANQVKVIFFEDFKSSTVEVYQQVLDFLSLDYDGKTEFPRVNANKTHRIKALGTFTQKPPQALVNLAAPVKQMLGLKSFGLMSALRKTNSQQLERSPLQAEFRSSLVDEFRGEIQKLSDLVNRDLNHWMLESR